MSFHICRYFREDVYICKQNVSMDLKFDLESNPIAASAYVFISSFSNCTLSINILYYMFQARKHNLACVNVPVKIYKEKCYVCFLSLNLDRVQPCILLTVKCFEVKHNLNTFQCHTYC